MGGGSNREQVTKGQVAASSRITTKKPPKAQDHWGTGVNRTEKAEASGWMTQTGGLQTCRAQDLTVGAAPRKETGLGHSEVQELPSLGACLLLIRQKQKGDPSRQGRMA